MPGPTPLEVMDETSWVKGAQCKTNWAESRGPARRPDVHDDESTST